MLKSSSGMKQKERKELKRNIDAEIDQVKKE
jgi:hypothetical protein